MASRQKRIYRSPQRKEAAAATRTRVLRAAKALFTRRGIDVVTIGEIAKRAGVSGSTIYAVFQSKEGLIRALVEGALFGAEYKAASSRLDASTDPVDQIRLSASIARAIYESESGELGLLRGASSFSVSLRRMEAVLEEMRFSLQEARVERLFAAKKAREGLSLAKARRVLWMYTSRDIYRLLVEHGGFTPDEYEAWLASTLVEALVSST
jgi:AcrR family transcriptional regulator